MCTTMRCGHGMRGGKTRTTIDGMYVWTEDNGGYNICLPSTCSNPTIQSVTGYLDFSAKIKRDIRSQAWNWMGVRNLGNEARVYLSWLMAFVYGRWDNLRHHGKYSLKSLSRFMPMTRRLISWSLSSRFPTDCSGRSRGTPPDSC